MPEGSEGWIALLLAIGGWLYTTILFLWRRRSEQEDVKAAEKRARLEARCEPVIPYAGALQSFIDDAVSWMQVLRERKASGASAQLVRRVEAELDKQWDEAMQLRPRPVPWFLLNDMQARARWLAVELAAQLCRERCIQCLKSGEVMSQEEAQRTKARGIEALEALLRRMEEVLAEADG